MNYFPRLTPICAQPVVTNQNNFKLSTPTKDSLGNKSTLGQTPNQRCLVTILHENLRVRQIKFSIHGIKG